ncbi:unnamed protein product [Caenorhabditis brenneri]
MENTSSIPLLKFPKNVALHILRTCGIREIFAISTLSNRSKALATSANIRATNIRVFIDSSIEFDIEHLSETLLLGFYDTIDNSHPINPKIVLDIPDEVWVSNTETEQWDNWKTSGKTIKDWSSHICQVFDWPSPGNENFPSFGSLSIAADVPNYSSMVLMNSFLLKVESLVLSRNPFENRLHLHKILIQNLNHLNYGRFEDQTFLNLNDLLMSNMQFLIASGDSLPEKHVNRFLKLWMNGMKTNLSMFHFAYPEDRIVDESQVLKGIKAQKVADDVERRIKYRTITGGWEIHGKNGKRATIAFIDGCVIRFMVWND